MDIPVNMKFCFEGMEESGSEGLDDLLFARKDTEFMQQVDYVCVHHKFSWILTFLFVIAFFGKKFVFDNDNSYIYCHFVIYFGS